MPSWSSEGDVPELDDVIVIEHFLACPLVDNRPDLAAYFRKYPDTQEVILQYDHLPMSFDRSERIGVVSEIRIDTALVRYWIRIAEWIGLADSILLGHRLRHSIEGNRQQNQRDDSSVVFHIASHLFDDCLEKDGRLVEVGGLVVSALQRIPVDRSIGTEIRSEDSHIKSFGQVDSKILNFLLGEDCYHSVGILPRFRNGLQGAEIPSVVHFSIIFRRIVESVSVWVDFRTIVAVHPARWGKEHLYPVLRKDILFLCVVCDGAKGCVRDVVAEEHIAFSREGSHDSVVIQAIPRSVKALDFLGVLP